MKMKCELLSTEMSRQLADSFEVEVARGDHFAEKDVTQYLDLRGFDSFLMSV